MVEIKKTSDISSKYLTAIVMGESGVGKTRFIGTGNPEETLIISVKKEGGLLTLSGKNIDYVEVDCLADVYSTIAWLKTNGSKYNYIGFDSLSELQKSLEKDKFFAGLSGFKLWAGVKEETRKVIEIFKSMPFHTVFTCHVDFEKDQEDGTFKYLPSLSGSSADDVIKWVDACWFMFKKQQNQMQTVQYYLMTTAASKYPCKTRISEEKDKLFPMIIENPNLENIVNTVFGKIDKKEQQKELEQVEVIAETKASESIDLTVTRASLQEKLEAHMVNAGISLSDLFAKHKISKKLTMPEMTREQIEFLLKKEGVK